MADRIFPTRVYLAEDCAQIRCRVAALLAERGMQVVGQDATARGAIAGILAARPDVVVLDVQLNGGSGLDVLRAVRAAQPGIAFVVLSIHAEAPYRERYLKQGASRFLDKATEFEQLAGAIDGTGPRTRPGGRTVQPASTSKPWVPSRASCATSPYSHCR